MSREEKLRKWREYEEEARRIRREMADWEFIEAQQPRVREALRLYVETGDIRTCSRLAGMDVEDFRELLRRARIPVVV